jgi:hypothetical protein
MKARLSIIFCGLSLAFTASATQLFVNGGFETGDTTGWVLTNSVGSSGSFFVTSSAVTPLTGNPTAGAGGGTYYAVSDQFGPGSYALTQSFVDPIGTTSAILSFDVFVNDVFGLGGSLGEVDLLAGGSNAITGIPISIFYSADTFDVGGAPNPYVHISLNISSFMTPGQTYTIRAIDTDTGPFNLGVDDFSLIATSATPEPGTMIPVAAAALLLAHRLRRKYTVSLSNKIAER